MTRISVPCHLPSLSTTPWIACMSKQILALFQLKKLLKKGRYVKSRFAQSAEQEGTVMDNGYHTELHTYSEREREREFSGNNQNLAGN